MLRDVVAIEEQRSDVQVIDVEEREKCWARTHNINKETTLVGMLLPGLRGDRAAVKQVRISTFLSSHQG